VQTWSFVLLFGSAIKFINKAMTSLCINKLFEKQIVSRVMPLSLVLTFKLFRSIRCVLLEAV